MIRRFVFDSKKDRVVEIRCNERGGADAREQYLNALGEYRELPMGNAQNLRDAALERAARREFAHRRYGDERRWKDT